MSDKQQRVGELALEAFMPYRLSIRSPMFITIPFVAKTMIGYKVADIPAIMGSFDPCIGETDR